MMEAKYKVGDVVKTIHSNKPQTIAEVVHLYKFVKNGTPWLERELLPCVSPIRIGDRVETGDVAGAVCCVTDSEVCLVADDGSGLWVIDRPDIKHIPEEAA